MIRIGKDIKKWSVRHIEEQGFTFKSVVNVNTHFIKSVQLSSLSFNILVLFPNDAFIG